jgi:hypothetical protein
MAASVRASVERFPVMARLNGPQTDAKSQTMTLAVRHVEAAKLVVQMLRHVELKRQDGRGY